MAITFPQGLKSPLSPRASLGIGAAVLATCAGIVLLRGTPAAAPVPPPPAIQSDPVPPAPAAPRVPATSTPPLTASDLSGVVLHGTLGNAAIVSTGGGAQRRVAVGRQLLPGLTLENTAADHVIIACGESRLRLPLAGFGGDASPEPQAVPSRAMPTAPTAPVAVSAGGPALTRADYSSANTRRQEIAFKLGLAASKGAGNNEGRITAHRVRRIDAMPLFSSAGLRDGDVITHINDGAFTTERLADLAYDLSQSKRVRITYERGGERHRAIVNLKD